jgi:cell surface protein SprA
MSVSSFATDLLYDPIQPTKINTITGSYYARLTIPNVVVNEQFAPLIGVDMKLKNDMSFKFEYKKSRNLSMSFIDYQLSETKTQDVTFGFGYTAKNIRLTFLDFLTNLDPSIKIKTKKDKNAKNAKNSSAPQPVGGANQPNNLNFKVDFSFRDDVTYNHVLDQNIVQPTRGTNTIKLSPSVDYTLNKSLNLRLFLDYTKTVPKTSASTPITQIRGGLTVRFTL